MACLSSAAAFDLTASIGSDYELILLFRYHQKTKYMYGEAPHLMNSKQRFRIWLFVWDQYCVRIMSERYYLSRCIRIGRV